MCLRVNSLRVFPDLILEHLVGFLVWRWICPQTFLLLDERILAFVEREVFPFPLPLQTSLAVVLRRIEQTPRTYPVIDNSHRLQSIGDDDVGVHCSHIDVVDEWQCLILVRRGHIPEGRQGIFEGFSYFFDIFDIAESLIFLMLDCELDYLVNAVNQVLVSLGVESEVSFDVCTENS